MKNIFLIACVSLSASVSAQVSSRLPDVPPLQSPVPWVQANSPVVKWVLTGPVQLRPLLKQRSTSRLDVKPRVASEDSDLRFNSYAKPSTSLRSLPYEVRESVANQTSRARLTSPTRTRFANLTTGQPDSAGRRYGMTGSEPETRSAGRLNATYDSRLFSRVVF